MRSLVNVGTDNAINTEDGETGLMLAGKVAGRSKQYERVSQFLRVFRDEIKLFSSKA